MAELLIVALLGGLITGLSPCIVPVLPVVVAGGATGSSRSRPYTIIGGLVVSFSIAELAGSSILNALHLPQDLLFWLGIGLLLVLAAGLLVPALGEIIERPFARLGSSRYATSGGGFLLGLSLGLVFVPCAGPVLTAISVAAAHHRVSATSLFVTISYAIGAAIPLLIFAVIAQRATTSWSRLRTHLPAVRKVAGAVLAVTTLAIAFNLLHTFQTDLPGYTTALENSLESGGSVCQQLQQLSGERANQFAAANARLEGRKVGCSGSAGSSTLNAPGSARGTSTKKTMAAVKSSLPKLGKAPDFTGIVAWLNTPGNKPLSLSALRGKIVLVDFWTYSCINCQRSLPHVEAWSRAYKSDGLVVVGVSTPEFAFEHVVSNVRGAAGNLGVVYPIAVDNDYGTWDAYGNQYWPAEYLIDQTGEVRAYDFGEGGYSTMETNIRSLLAANGVMNLPPRTDVPNKTPTVQTTQESYLGYDELQYAVGTTVVHDKATDYHAPSSIPLDSLAFSGTWTDHKEEATAGKSATLLLHFTANDVYLVIGGQGTVDVSFNGRHLSTVNVSGIPTLYTLFSGGSLQTGLLSLSVSPGVEAYDFTFG